MFSQIICSLKTFNIFLYALLISELNTMAVISEGGLKLKNILCCYQERYRLPTVLWQYGHHREVFKVFENV